MAIHNMCKSSCRIERQRLKIKMNDIYVEHFSRNDSHYNLHVAGYGYLGTFVGCCKWDAITECLKNLKIENKIKETM